MRRETGRRGEGCFNPSLLLPLSEWRCMHWSIFPFRSPPSNCMWRLILAFAGEAAFGIRGRWALDSFALTGFPPMSLAFRRLHFVNPERIRGCHRNPTIRSLILRRYLCDRILIDSCSYENTTLRRLHSRAKRNSNNNQRRGSGAID